MSPQQALLAGLGALAAVYAILIYNSLVRLKHNVRRAWSNIDVLLRQRHDELPELVRVCKGYRDFERDVLVRVTEARTRVARARSDHDMAGLGAAEDDLHAGLAQVFALAEQYPDLKANQHFLALQQRISALENAIADRREWYNESVNLLNTRIEQLPDLFVARLAGVRPEALLKVLAHERQRPALGEALRG